MDKIRSLTGMPDYSEKSEKDNVAAKLFHVENSLKEIFKTFNITEIRTPALERTSLFQRSVGDFSDIVNKELYSFNDKNDRSITLRPEGTAGVIRHIVENNLESYSNKFWYMGPMWRYERPQKGRYRQFNQAGIEYLGYEEGLAELELISIVCLIIEKLNIKNSVIKINHLGNESTKAEFAEAIKNYFEPYKSSLDEIDIDRLESNPLRLLDTKNKDLQKVLRNAPVLTDFLPKNSIDLLNHIKASFQSVEIEIDPTLVRGLDYYNGFVFEAISNDLGAQSSFLGGGRYDNLSSQLGGKIMNSIGMAIGLERISEISNIETDEKNRASFIILAGVDHTKAYKMAHELRSLNENVILETHLNCSSLKAELRRANKCKSQMALIIGEEELKNNKILIKDLKNESNEQKNVSYDELIKIYKNL